jgi:hypothetical protein
MAAEAAVEAIAAPAQGLALRTNRRQKEAEDRLLTRAARQPDRGSRRLEMNWIAVLLTITLGGSAAAQSPGVTGVPPPRAISFTARPNPIVLEPGATVGATTLNWNAPGYSRLVLKVNGISMSGTVGASGSIETGKWVGDGAVFELVDLVSGKTMAGLVVETRGGGTPQPTSLSANPNPIVLVPGQGAGKTTLSWNAPGYDQVFIRINGTNMTGTRGTSGSVETGNWVSNGSVFELVDAVSGRVLATVTVAVTGGGAPPPVSFTANPNPIVLEPGQATGRTTLSWNAPGYEAIFVRINGTNFTGTRGASGSVKTGDWVANGAVFELVDAASGRVLATVTVRATARGPVTFTASPNPIVLAPGASSGRTTLTWNAPGYGQLFIRFNGSTVAGGLSASGSIETGDYVVNGARFELVEAASGRVLATVTVETRSSEPGTTFSFYAQNMGQAPFDKLVEVIEVKWQPSKIAYTAAGGWTIVGNAFFWAGGIPLTAFQRLEALANQGEEIRGIAFTPAGGWVLWYGFNGWWAVDVPAGLIDALRDVNTRQEQIRNVAFTASGGWALNYGFNGFRASTIPGSAASRLEEFNRNRTEMKGISFGPGNAWVIWGTAGVFWASGVSQALFDKLTEYSRDGWEFQDIAFRGADGWVVLAKR